jgi:glyoxalase family protein
MGAQHKIAGLHHVALVSSDFERTRDFYERILGLRLAGVGEAPLTVHGSPAELRRLRSHWFGDGHSRPGSLIAVLEQPRATQGAPGIGGSHHFALCVENRDILLQWKRRFLDNGYAVNGILDRHYFQSIYIKDPDGQIVELATRGPGWTKDEAHDRIGTEHRVPPEEMVNTNRDRARIAAENWPDPVETISEQMRIQGLHHVTAIGIGIERTESFVSGALGMRRVKRTNNFDDVGSFHWYWGVGNGPPGTLITYFERKPEREAPVRMGAGQLAHYGVAADPDTFAALHEQLSGSTSGASHIEAFEIPGGIASTRFDAFSCADPDGHPVVVASMTREPSYNTDS